MPTLRRFALLLISLGGPWCASPGSAGEVPRLKPIDAPRVHLTWNAPWGDSLASSSLTVDCADTSRVDLLFLTFESPRNILPLTGVSGTLLFEPEAGDTLGPFWFFERQDRNAGSLAVDFNLRNAAGCLSAWRGKVDAGVGYGRVGQRGRLDLSADVAAADAQNLNPNTCFMFARVVIRHNRSELDGCKRPMRITWVGGRFRSHRPGSEELTTVTGPGHSVTWNAPRSGVNVRRSGPAIVTWVPRFAPSSRAALQLRAFATPPSPASSGN